MAVAKESKDNYNYNEKLTSTLTRAGFYGITRMANTLQGNNNIHCILRNSMQKKLCFESEIITTIMCNFL